MSTFSDFPISRKTLEGEHTYLLFMAFLGWIVLSNSFNGKIIAGHSFYQLYFICWI